MDVNTAAAQITAALTAAGMTVVSGTGLLDEIELIVTVAPGVPNFVVMVLPQPAAGGEAS